MGIFTAKCECCGQVDMKGNMRRVRVQSFDEIGYEGDGTVWMHESCAPSYFDRHGKVCPNCRRIGRSVGE